MVMGRRSGPNGLPPDLVDLLILRSGCPVLLAPAAGHHSVTGTVLVCWNESVQSAHAVSAALPLLTKAERVVVIGVHENNGSTADALKEGLHETGRLLSRHAIEAETQFVPAEGRLAPDVIASIATARRASLLVMGAYGRSRMREVVFGGCTRHFVSDESFAVLLAH